MCKEQGGTGRHCLKKGSMEMGKENKRTEKEDETREMEGRMVDCSNTGHG